MNLSSEIFPSKKKISGYWWLMHVVLGTQEAEIRRIAD
jgi:hypothetical protein